MVFWRKKKNVAEQEEQEREDKIVHHPGEPEIEPPTEYDSDLSPDSWQPSINIGKGGDDGKSPAAAGANQFGSSPENRAVFIDARHRRNNTGGKQWPELLGFI